MKAQLSQRRMQPLKIMSLTEKSMTFVETAMLLKKKNLTMSLVEISERVKRFCAITYFMILYETALDLKTVCSGEDVGGITKAEVDSKGRAFY